MPKLPHGSSGKRVLSQNILQNRLLVCPNCKLELFCHLKQWRLQVFSPTHAVSDWHSTVLEWKHQSNYKHRNNGTKNDNNQALFIIEFWDLDVVTHDAASLCFLPIRVLTGLCFERWIKYIAVSRNRYSGLNIRRGTF